MKFPFQLLFLLFLPVLSQAQSKISVSGHIQDEAGEPLSYTSVLILEPADSALVTYALTDDKGDFQFKHLPRKPLLLKATYVSFLPYQVGLEMPETGDLTLEPIVLKPIARELYEVVVKTAKAPISIKGDTIEYDASKFKVPPGATLEELIRKLPGVEVDKDGNVVAQGEQVQKVTVDGRRFFGNNTKVATQNLNADAVKKVQFFDDKSEQSKLTGVQDGVREKTMNVELKEEAKKGGFGKITAAAGTDNRWNTSGLFNRFDKVNQFSILGYGNNINRSGLSWDDKQEFQGSGGNFGAWTDFGFNVGGMTFIYFNGGDNEESFDIPWNDLSTGYSNNQAVGANYNFQKKKVEFSSNYFFSRSDQIKEGFEQRTNLIDNKTSFQTRDDNSQTNLAGHHRLSLRFQSEIDSLNTLTVLGRGRYSNLSSGLTSQQALIRSSGNSSFMNRENSTAKDSYAYLTALIYRHKFRKNGRNFAFSFSSDAAKADLEGTQKATVDLLNSTDPTSFFRNLDQLNATINSSATNKSSLLYVEPLSKVWFIESFYNFSLTQNNTDRRVFDVIPDAANSLNENLSRNLNNQILFNRVGTSLRFSQKGNNLSVGLAAARYDLSGEYAIEKNAGLLGQINRRYQAFTPNVSFYKNMKGNKYFSFGYGMGLTPPSLTDLQPYKDISNPLYVREGNPDLLPQTGHSFNAYYNQFDPATFIRFYGNLSFTAYKDQIVQNQIIDPETLVTTFIAGNVSGGNTVNGYASFGFPIVKTKASMNIGLSPSFRKFVSLINSIENNTQSNGGNLRVGLDLTPVDWFSFYTGVNTNRTWTSYELNEAQNQIIIRNGAYARMNLKIPGEVYIDGDFNYSRYLNERFGFDQKIPILNTSIYTRVGKNKKVELRLSGYDLFKRNVGVSQQASQNFVFQREILTLSRFFLFGVTYNMRGIEIDKNRRFQ